MDLQLCSMLDCIHIYVFLFLKNFLKQSRYLSIARLSIETLLLPFIAFSITTLIHRETFWMLNSFSIATSIHRAFLLWKPLDSCSIAISIEPLKLMSFYIQGPRESSLISLRFLSIAFISSLPKTSLSYSKLHPQLIFGLNQVFLHW